MDLSNRHLNIYEKAVRAKDFFSADRDKIFPGPTTKKVIHKYNKKVIVLLFLTHVTLINNVITPNFDILIPQQKQLA